MKIKHIFLTSGMIMAIATFPAISEELYDEDIAGQCQVSFLGGTGADNSTAPNSFQAQYDANEYTVSAGQYLAADAITGTQCPANSFCPGGEYTFSETNNQGITACPTGFTLSAAGASAQTDCYRTCTTDDVAHSATVSGGFYYGNNNQCVPESCVTGYHVSSNSDIYNHQTLLDFMIDYDGYSSKEEVESDFTTDAEIMSYINDFYDSGKSTAALKAYSMIPSADAYLKTIKPNADIYESGNWNNAKYKSINGTGRNSSDTSGLENGEWSVLFSYGSIKGTAKCTATATNGEYLGTQGNPNATTDGEARYCWCHADSIDGTSVSSSWVFHSDYGTADYCADGCAFSCASDVGRDSRIRGALFGEGSAKSECVANEINVNWYNGETLYETNQCTYDGAITLPTAPEKTGYTFTGWKLVTGSSN